MILIINIGKSNNINKFWVGIVTRQGHINQVWIRAKIFMRIRIRIRILGVSGEGLGVRENEFFFWVFITFQMILNNGCLKSEQKKWNCLHCTSPTLQNNEYSFISYLFVRIRIRKFMRIRIRIRAGQKHADPADPDPKPWYIRMKINKSNSFCYII